MNHSLKITNSLTRKKELFKPINSEQITMYACGPTIYDNPQNVLSYLVFTSIQLSLATEFASDFDAAMNMQF